MHKRGFTLIELMVSVAIFAIIMTIALGSLLAISAADRKAETLKSVMDNLNFALDSMSRAVRTGSAYHCGTSNGGDCAASGSTYFAFTASDGSFVEYKLDTTSSGCSGGCISRQVTPSGGSASGFLPITTTEVNISTLKFYLLGYCSASGLVGTNGSCTADKYQPKVTIVLSGSMQINISQTTAFNVQTTAVQRIYDQ